MLEACKKNPYVVTATNETDISSPNYPLSYDNNMDCTWIIIANKKSHIQLSVRGELEMRFVIKICERHRIK